MKKLHLPEGPRRLWLTTGAAVVDTLRERGCSVSLGGGTLLAARWNHRASHDVDLKVRPEDATRLNGAALDADFSAWLRKTGRQGRLESEGWINVWKIGGTETAQDHGVVEVIAGRLAPRAGTTRSDVDGIGIVVQSNAQIFAGKAIRIGSRLPRDLFDVRVAQLRDPDAIRRAANCLTPEAMRNRLEKLRRPPDSRERENWTKLEGVAGEYRHLLDDLAAGAAETWNAAFYTAVRATSREGRLTIEWTTAGGTEGVASAATPDDAQALEAEGFHEYFENAGVALEDLVGRARTAEGAIATIEDAGTGAAREIRIRNGGTTKGPAGGTERPAGGARRNPEPPERGRCR